MARVRTFGGCVRLVDLFGDGEDKLVVADQEGKMRVYRGTSMMAEHALLDQPSALACFYSDNNAPRVPAVAVGAGSFVFIYRNLRPYYKFVLPTIELQVKHLSR